MVSVAHEDDADAHEDADKVDEQFRRVPREVSVPLRGLFHDQLGVENYVPGDQWGGGGGWGGYGGGNRKCNRKKITKKKE